MVEIGRLRRVCEVWPKVGEKGNGDASGFMMRRGRLEPIEIPTKWRALFAMPLRFQRFIRQKSQDVGPLSSPFSLASMARAQTKHSLIPLLMSASIPVLLFAGWIAYGSAQQQRKAVLDKASATAELVGERIMGDIETQVQMAATLALSPSLDQPDLSAFYHVAKRIALALPLWESIELDDLDGLQLMNTIRPLNSQLGETGDRQSLDQVIQSHRPVVGGVGEIGRISGRRLIKIRVPVIRDGHIRYVLTVALAEDAVAKILHDTGVPEGWVGAVFDKQGHLIARTTNEEQTFIKMADLAMRHAMAQSTGGPQLEKPPADVDIDTVFKTMPGAGDWTVHLAIPSAVLNGPVRRAVIAVAGGVVTSLFLAVGLAVLVSTDIARKRRQQELYAAAALKVSEERGALAIDAAELGTWRWDFGQNKLAGSPRCRLLLGLQRSLKLRETLSAERFLALVDRDDRARVLEAAEACFRDDRAFEVEFRVAGPDGSFRWLRARGRTVLRDQDVIFGVLADVTSEKYAEADRLKLLRRLAEAQEEVQARIARELHDQVGQTVTGLSLGLKGLERALNYGEGWEQDKLHDLVHSLQLMTAEIGRDIHSVAVNLRPTSLDDLGLYRALSAYVTEWSQRYDVSVDFQAIGAIGDGFGREVDTVIYRVLQEALTNILKHAAAKVVGIILERREREIRLLIEDDGSGFDPRQLNRIFNRDDMVRRRSLGLSGMQERLMLIGGVLQVESSPGQGATLFIRIPIPQSTGNSSLGMGSNRESETV